MELSELFWNSSVEEMSRGYVYREDEKKFVCLVCGKHYTKGVIYSAKDTLMEAELFVESHILEEHGSMFTYLLGLDKKVTGLTEHQSKILGLFFHGLSDAEIAKKLGTSSTSTIRNHRFSLREKEKQARVLLAIMRLLETSQSRKEESFVSIHRTARMVDERYAVTEAENEQILAKYFEEGPDGPLSKFPNREKRKLVILRHIMSRFDQEQKYTEKQVNEILKALYFDFVTIRRYLIEYGFMDRERDGSLYWVKK